MSKISNIVFPLKKGELKMVLQNIKDRVVLFKSNIRNTSNETNSLASDKNFNFGVFRSVASAQKKIIYIDIEKLVNFRIGDFPKL